MVLSSIVIASLVAIATALGIVHRSLTGRVQQVTGRAHQLGATVELPHEVVLGARATLVQFSTEICSPCRATHTVLDSLSRELDGLNHIDVDITTRRDLANQYRIMQTPTTLILDADGTVRARIGGAAKRETILAELDRILVTA